MGIRKITRSTSSKSKENEMNHLKMDSSSQKPAKSDCSVSFSAYKSFLYAFLGGLCFSMNSVLVRFAKDTPAMQMSMYRFVGMLFFSLPFAAHKGVNLIGPKASRKMLLYRAIVAFFTIVFSFFSFRYLPIGEASVIVYSTPVFVTIFAKILLKEVCGVVQSIIVGLTIVGIILIINPLTLIDHQNHIHATDHTLGVLFGLGGLFSMCAMVILTRQTRSVHYSVVSVTTSAIGAALTLALMGSAYDPVFPRCGVRRWVAIAMGLSSSLGQLFYIRALQLENVGPVATLKAATDITIAITWQVAIFRESLDNFAISGTALVVMSVILIGVRKWVILLPKNSPIRKKLKLLTY